MSSICAMDSSNLSKNCPETSESDAQSHEEGEVFTDNTSSLASDPPEHLTLEWCASQLCRVDQFRGITSVGDTFYIDVVHAFAHVLGKLPVEEFKHLVPTLNENGDPKLLSKLSDAIITTVFEYYYSQGGKLKKSIPKINTAGNPNEANIARVISRRKFNTKTMIKDLLQKKGTYQYSLLIVIKLFNLRNRSPDDPNQEDVFTKPMLDTIQATCKDYKTELVLPKKYKDVYRVSDLVSDPADESDRNEDDLPVDPNAKLTVNQIAQKLKASNRGILNLEGSIKQAEKSLRDKQAKLAFEIQKRECLLEELKTATEREKTMKESENVFGSSADGFSTFNQLLTGANLYLSGIYTEKQLNDVVFDTMHKVKESRKQREQQPQQRDETVTLNNPYILDPSSGPSSSPSSLEVVSHPPPRAAASERAHHQSSSVVVVDSDNSMGQAVSTNSQVVSTVPVFLPLQPPFLRPPRLGLVNPNLLHDPTKDAATEGRSYSSPSSPTPEELFGTFRCAMGSESPLPYGNKKEDPPGFQDLIHSSFTFTNGSPNNDISTAVPVTSHFGHQLLQKTDVIDHVGLQAGTPYNSHPGILVFGQGPKVFLGSHIPDDDTEITKDENAQIRPIMPHSVTCSVEPFPIDPADKIIDNENFGRKRSNATNASTLAVSTKRGKTRVCDPDGGNSFDPSSGSKDPAEAVAN